MAPMGGAGAGYGAGPGRFGRFGGMFGGGRNTMNAAGGPEVAQTGPSFPQPTYPGGQGQTHVLTFIRYSALTNLTDLTSLSV